MEAVRRVIENIQMVMTVEVILSGIIYQSYWGADKSVARPGRKQAIVTKL